MKRLSIMLTILLLLTTNILSEDNKTVNREEMKKMDIESFKKYQDNGAYRFTLADGTKVVQQGEIGKFFVERRTNPATVLFEDYILYFSTGEVKVKGVNYKNSFAYGIWLEYDKKGNIIDRVDYDKEFIYTWDDIEKFCSQYHIDLLNRFTWISRYSRDAMIDLYKPENIRFQNSEIALNEYKVFLDYETKIGKVNKIWQITYEYTSGIKRTIYIDAKQGNVMYITEAPLSQDRPAYFDKKRGAVFIDESKIVEKFDN